MLVLCHHLQQKIPILINRDKALKDKDLIETPDQALSRVAKGEGSQTLHTYTDRQK